MAALVSRTVTVVSEEKKKNGLTEVKVDSVTRDDDVKNDRMSG